MDKSIKINQIAIAEYCPGRYAVERSPIRVGRRVAAISLAGECMCVFFRAVSHSVGSKRTTPLN